MQQTIRDAFSGDQVVLKVALEPILIFSPLLQDSITKLDDFEELKKRVLHYRQVLKEIELNLPRSKSVGSRYLIQLGRLKSSLRSKVLMFEVVTLHFVKWELKSINNHEKIIPGNADEPI